MPTTAKILNELYNLQAFGEQVKQKATSLINMMEGEGKTSPSIKRSLAAKAINRRNVRIIQKQKL